MTVPYLFGMDPARTVACADFGDGPFPICFAARALGLNNGTCGSPRLYLTVLQ